MGLNRRVLVTGAAGFIGSRLAVALARAGCDVSCVDLRLPSPAVCGVATRVLQCDCAAPAVTSLVLEGAFDAVVHQAAISNTLEADWSRLRRVNVDAARELADACGPSGTTFLYASSFSVYGRGRDRTAVREEAVDEDPDAFAPLNLYARSKLELDRAMRTRAAPDLRWAGLRYTNVFEADEEQEGRASSIISQVVGRAARGEPIVLFADTLLACRDYVPVARVGAVVRRLVEAAFVPGVYNVGAGTATSFATLLRWCAEFDERRPLEVRLVRNPIPDRYQYWTCADLTRLAGLMPGIRPLTEAELRDEAARLFEHARPK
jgi:ADP-L-glycero-D-manno-heptose 6-epimerase